MAFRKNILANYAATGWVTVVGLVFVPVYISYIGIESYGMLGVYYALLALSSLLDFGMTTTVTREMARASLAGTDARITRDLVRTLEILYWALGLVLGIALLFGASVLAHHWLRPVRLSPTEVHTALRLIALALALQWPYSFYVGGLMGLQRQVQASGVNAGMMTARAAGAVLVLRFVAPTISAFFWWQIVVNGVSTALVARLLWRGLPGGGVHARFRPDALRGVRRFTAGVTAVSVIGLLLLQADKIVLSRILTLDEFGYYALAGTVAASLLLLVRPIYDAVFPRLTQLVTIGDEKSVASFYHQSCQALSVAVLPAAFVLAAFGSQVVFAWMGSADTAARLRDLVAFLTLGTALFALAHVPWALQLAHGWTGLGIRLNVGALLVSVPLTIGLSLRYGALGGAAAFFGWNVVYLAGGMALMHRRLLRGRLGYWFLSDIGAPGLAAGTVVLLARLVLPGEMSRLGATLFVFAVGVLASTAAAVAAPGIRGHLVHAGPATLLWRLGIR